MLLTHYRSGFKYFSPRSASLSDHSGPFKYVVELGKKQDSCKVHQALGCQTKEKLKKCKRGRPFHKRKRRCQFVQCGRECLHIHRDIHKLGGVVNTAIILGVAAGILGSNNRTLFDTLDPGNALKLQNFWESQN